MKISRALVALALLALVYGTSTAQGVQAPGAAPKSDATPFGLRRGMTLAELGKAEAVGQGMYKLVTVPKPHPDFEAYVVQVGPRTGLCFVKAVGKDVVTSVYGHELKSQYAKIRDQLAATYGKYEEIDRLGPGSIWDEPRDWMMGLVKKERFLFVKWDSASGSTLRPGLRDIFLAASALSANKGYVALEYYFDNEPQCDKEIDSASGSVL